MSNVDNSQDPQKSDKPEDSSAPSTNSTTVPQWLRTSIVAAFAICFFVHLTYDALNSDYSEFNTSLLLIGFVGTALGFDVMGRR